MTTAAAPLVAVPAARRTQVLADVGPHWFAWVMGTGVVAVAVAGLPFRLPGGVALATGSWLLASTLLVAVGLVTVLQHLHHPDVARGHLTDPVLGPFYGAPPMALMTVGAGALLVGEPVLGARGAVGVAAALWTLGTLGGLVTTVAVPWRLLAARRLRLDAAYGGWLMPVVPPMVSAATGALLLPHVAAGTLRQGLLAACWTCFGVSLAASVLVIGLVVRRLVRHGVGPDAGVPTLFIVLGPLGQSVTAVHHLAPDHAVAYGAVVGGLALVWLAGAGVVVARTARRGLPFTPSWWSFTFPVGTLVTGASGLAVLTGLVALQVLAGVLFAGLVAAWLVVAPRTARWLLRR